jgi:hypothetical protein
MIGFKLTFKSLSLTISGFPMQVDNRQQPCARQKNTEPEKDATIRETKDQKGRWLLLI